MKIYQKWIRNEPDTVTGESITVTITYCSFDRDEIDELQKKMPKGMLVMDTEQKTKGRSEELNESNSVKSVCEADVSDGMVDNIINAIDICLGNGHCVNCWYRVGGTSTGNCRDRMLSDAKGIIMKMSGRVNEGCP